MVGVFFNYCTTSDQHQCSILVLDELDHVMACSRSLKSLSSLSQANASKLRIIGIANTHTLTSSPSLLEYGGANSVKTLHFSPYSPEQLLDILQARLSPLYQDPLVEKSVRQLLPTPALTLLTKKIASQTGDVRALFEALRGAIDISIAAMRPKQNPLDCTPTVTPANILSAFKAYVSTSSTPFRTPAVAGSSEVFVKVQGLGLHGRFILLSLSLACRRLESKIPLLTPSNTPKSSARSPSKRSTPMSLVKASIDATQLYLYYTNLLVKGSGVFNPVSRSEFGDVVNMLETLGLVVSSSSSTSPKKLGRKLSSRSSSFSGSAKSAGSAMIAFVDGVRMDEIMRGLGVGQSQDPKVESDVKEEEMRIIWDKEMREIRRQTSANEHSKDATSGGFEDMSED
jgi:cell division control protein 6